MAFQRGLHSAPTGQRLKAQDWRAFRQPWEKCEYNANPEGVVSGRNPFRVEIQMNPIPELTAKGCGQSWALGRNAFGVESSIEAGIAGLLSQLYG